ncbi:MAG: potassium channel family protein [Actinobacteria bacterium]|nr:potassium channel family protein [Actinomycetota bacterium]
MDEPDANASSSATTHRADRRPLRAESPRFADSFGLVLLLLVSSYFVLAGAGDGTIGRVVSVVILAATTWLALRAAQVRRHIMRIALAVIPLATVVAAVLIVVGSEETASIVNRVLIILLVVVAPVAILRRLVERPVMSLNAFYGAVCVYLLIAMFFATVYGLTAVIGDRQFFAQLSVPPKDTPTVDYLYFSFVTITTTGYGDLTAVTTLGRLTAVMEAIFGQLYLITVVALVVQDLSRRRIGHRTDDQPRRDAGRATDRDADSATGPPGDGPAPGGGAGPPADGGAGPATD